MRTGPQRTILALGATLLCALAGPPGAPAGNTVAKRAAATAASSACFGAAARDAERPCTDARLRYAVSPKPDDAELQPGSPCTIVATKGPPNRVCAFGVPRSQAVATIGLIGDSHAPTWRGAVDSLARAQRWRGFTVRRSSCPFTFTRRHVDRASGEACQDWVYATLRFLGHHPEIRTVFLVNSSAYSFLPSGGLDGHAAAVAGYRRVLSALPASVTRVVVLRDNPKGRPDTLACVDRERRRHHRADLRCAIPRASALLPDPLAEAAASLPDGRGHVIDLTRFFCDERLCYPVVGGALVYKDESHITATFSGSLGPYLTSAYRSLTPATTAPPS